MRPAAATCAVAVLGLALYWAVLLACADSLYRGGSPAGISRARELVPANAAFFEGDAGDLAALRRGVLLNPRASPRWIELGLLQEAGGQLPQAEESLLAAARVDRTYQPLWSLANFYFRQNEPDKFFQWARRAAGMAYRDQTPLFQLCWRVSQDPAVILERAIPEITQVQAQYLNFLLGQKKLAEAKPAAAKVLAAGRQDHLPVLLSLCGRLIDAADIEGALGVWNSLCARGLLPYSSLDPEQDKVLTNGEFAMEPCSAGFDWRVSPAEGITAIREAQPRSYRINFSGRQPERWVVLEQVLPVRPSRTYRLACTARGVGIPASSGLRWVVSKMDNGIELGGASLRFGEGSWDESPLTFAAPPDARAVRLMLEYRRAPGTTRFEGTLWLRQISATAIP